MSTAVWLCFFMHRRVQWKFAAKAAHGPQAFLPCRMTAYSEVDGKEVEKYQCLKKVPTEGGLGRMSPFGE